MIFSDTTVTLMTTHRTIRLDGPKVRTKFKSRHRFKVDTIKVVWYDDLPPETCTVYGFTKKGHRVKRGYHVPTAPKWLKEALNA